MKKFVTYELAVTFYRAARTSNLPYFLKNQLLRASSSVALNLREGSANRSPKMRQKYYRIAFASAKECQAIFDLEPNQKLERQIDCICAHIYRLMKSHSS